MSTAKKLFVRLATSGVALGGSAAAFADPAAGVDPSSLLSNIDFTKFSTQGLVIGGGVVLVALVITGIYLSTKVIKPARSA